MTSQRSLIYNIIQNSCDHLTADEVFIQAKGIDKKIVHATVYNSLNYLSEQGLIKRVIIPHQPDHFDHTLYEHNHFVCEKCGKVFDLPNITLDLKEFNNGFHINGYLINFFGTCQNCYIEEEK
jgi:Fe2+ or Zn2+ uptake regulation protein